MVNFQGSRVVSFGLVTALIAFGADFQEMQYLVLSSSSSLPQWSVEEGLSLRLVPADEDAGRSLGEPRRSSPVHPLVNGVEVPDLTDGTWIVHLLVPRDAFSLLGRISKRAYPGLEASTWFGIGMASVVIFARHDENVTGLVDDMGADLLCHEEWTADSGQITKARLVKLPSPLPLDASLSLPTFNSELPSDLRGIFEEFGDSFRDLYRWSSFFAPDEVSPLGLLFVEVRGLVAELLWLRAGDSSGDTPKGLREFELSDPLVRSRLIQQRTDRIVQINSAMSYVISQACYGAPPILSDSSLIRRHSLLGVGRAHRALVNLVREIERTLHNRSVPESIYRAWRSFPALPGFGSARERDTSGWGGLELPDTLQPGSAGPQPPKLVYFSGRLGFRESEYSISAAIHTLTSGDAPEWHLSTMTHEILHGHVRSIINAVFDRVRQDDPKKTGEFWERIFTRFSAHMRGSLRDGKLIDSARSVLLAYCCLAPEMGSLTQLPSKPTRTRGGAVFGALVVPDDAAALRRRLEEENRNISEILVHTLDLFYFYDDDFESYSRAVWSSWRTVPAVLRDVRQYVLRMLLAKTSIDKGEEIERFARARNQVFEVISRLNAGLGGDAVLERAAELLQLEREIGITERTSEANHPLFQPFYAAIGVVDFARSCLASGMVREALFGDDIIDPGGGEGGLEFEYVAGQFSDRRVRSIAEFTTWRARSGAATSGEPDEERRTAWLFLACGALVEARLVSGETDNGS